MEPLCCGETLTMLRRLVRMDFVIGVIMLIHAVISADRIRGAFKFFEP